MDDFLLQLSNLNLSPKESTLCFLREFARSYKPRAAQC